MLVLTRKTQERIHIGNNITITILKLKGNTVRIGIEAPRDVRVMRGELPTFDGTFEAEAGETATAKTRALESTASGTGGGAERSEEEATVSELEWEVLKRIASRRKSCLPARRCSPKQIGAAPLASAMRATSLAVARVDVTSH